MAGNFYVHANDQITDLYRIDWVRISYNFSGTEIARCNYQVNNSQIIYSGRDFNGDYWDIKSTYWLNGDTLIIRADGGFEYTDAYWVRTK